MLGGTWMPELIELAGGHPGRRRSRRPRTDDRRPPSWRSLEPDVVLVKPCGYSLERWAPKNETSSSATVIAPLRGSAPVYLTDGNAFFNRPGPRIVESLEILAACTHPDAFSGLRAKPTRRVIERLA